MVTKLTLKAPVTFLAMFSLAASEAKWFSLQSSVFDIRDIQVSGVVWVTHTYC
jgi:hypothetical protein